MLAALACRCSTSAWASWACCLALSASLSCLRAQVPGQAGRQQPQACAPLHSTCTLCWWHWTPGQLCSSASGRASCCGRQEGRWGNLSCFLRRSVITRFTRSLSASCSFRSLACTQDGVLTPTHPVPAHAVLCHAAAVAASSSSRHCGLRSTPGAGQPSRPAGWLGWAERPAKPCVLQQHAPAWPGSHRAHPAAALRSPPACAQQPAGLQQPPACRPLPAGRAGRWPRRLPAAGPGTAPPAQGCLSGPGTALHASRASRQPPWPAACRTVCALNAAQGGRAAPGSPAARQPRPAACAGP